MSNLKIGDRVVAVIDGRKYTGAVRGLQPPQGVSHPERTVHVTLDEPGGMLRTKWVAR